MTSVTRTPASTPKRASKMPSNQNLNHLLNFTLAPQGSLSLRVTYHGGAGRLRTMGSGIKSYRFVMNPTGDYTVHFADPDMQVFFFQWQDILQVIIPRSSALASASSGSEEGHTSCPICLEPPTAPRMTKCGHVFCFPCILHYLNTSDNKWARCPICFDSVNEKQLKSVKWFDGASSFQDDEQAEDVPCSSSSVSTQHYSATPREGSLMRMRLMQRPQITTLALPRSNTWPSDLLPPHQAPFHFLPDVYDFAKFMLATPDYLIHDLTQELTDLAAERRTMSGFNDDLGVVFVDAADAKIRHQIEKASALESSHLKSLVDKASQEQRDIERRFVDQERKQRIDSEKDVYDEMEIPQEFLATKSLGFALPTIDAKPPPSPNPGRTTPKQRRNLNPPPPSTSTYYFYQAASGFPVYLHPLDIKILVAHFNGYASFPDVITFRVEALSEGTVNDDLRKRCKYLAHLPEGADVVFVEADLESVVGKAGLSNFEGPLRMRRARRKEKGKKDDRAKARAEGRERERERDLRNGNGNTRRDWVREDYLAFTTDPPISTPTGGAAVVANDAPPVPTPPSQASGAWGARSFASALHSPANPVASRQGASRTRTTPQDEWDMDVAWHELERGSGGRKKRGATKLVVLGGGGPGAGRRR
ncbi:hypothetical protein ONZ45_g10899 [Pleurotus djamor]|nr:hypothetical protein ONZ45_g10899 [Pleurotus djamor]